METQGYEFRATLLKVEGVSLCLGDRQVLRDVTMEIRDIHREDQITGQVVGLLGPSGMGKTRLFRILAGLDAPDSGSVLIGEKGVPAAPGMVGVIAQHYPLFMHRTVIGNLLVAAKGAGLSHEEATDRAKNMLQRLALSEYGARYPSELSGGQRQRIAIAQQFMCSEHFLLMDEPFSGLDVNAVEDVCSLISEMAHAHTLNTIVVVTHDIGAAIAVCDTIWLLGRDRDESGQVIPGARVQATYDLKERGLAWRQGIVSLPEFAELQREIRSRFASL